MARRLSSPIFVGRSRELQELLSAADSAAVGPAGARPRRRRGRRRQEPPGRGGRRASARPTAGWSSRAARSRSVRMGSRSARSSKPFARWPARSTPTRIAEAAGPSLPELARLVPEVAPVGAEVARRRPDRMAPDPHLRGRPAAVRQARRDDSGPARHRGPALGRPFDPRPARVPDAQRARRAPADDRDVPER